MQLGSTHSLPLLPCSGEAWLAMVSRAAGESIGHVIRHHVLFVKAESKLDVDARKQRGILSLLQLILKVH